MAKTKDKIELKDKVDRERFARVLRDWADAMDRDEDLEVIVKDEIRTIPKEVYANAKLEIEYELEPGEGEFEMEMKWRT